MHLEISHREEGFQVFSQVHYVLISFFFYPALLSVVGRMVSSSEVKSWRIFSSEKSLLRKAEAVMTSFTPAANPAFTQHPNGPAIALVAELRLDFFLSSRWSEIISKHFHDRKLATDRDVFRKAWQKLWATWVTRRTDTLQWFLYFILNGSKDIFFGFLRAGRLWDN